MVNSWTNAVSVRKVPRAENDKLLVSKMLIACHHAIQPLQPG